jgi:predicted nucleotidyltransferase
MPVTTVGMDQIESLSNEIARHFHPERIILFGSYAQGKPSEASDVDLLVVLPFEGKSVYKALEIRKKVRPSFSVDLIVRTPQHVGERVANGDWFIRDIIENGRTLYEADNGGVGAEG